MSKYKLAILTSHPIQYQGPLFRKLAENPQIDLTVYFCWEAAKEKKVLDREFGKEIKWDIPILEGYKYKFLGNWSPWSSSEFWGQINPGIIQGIKYQVSSIKYDAVLVFGWNSFTNWLAFLTAFFLKIPVFLRGENPLSQELLKSRWKIKIKKVILGWLFRRVSAFLYIGEENRKFYEFYGAPEKKLFFCPYAVDSERFINASKALSAKRKSLRNELSIADEQVVILFVGKLIEKKRPFDLLRAYQQLTTNNLQPTTKTALLFVGDGVLRQELENYAKERNIKNVHFAGFKNQSELPKYYAMSDIFVLPSGVGETWGLAVNEAMCFGLPVIVSDLVGCAPDLVQRGKNGYVYQAGDVKKLSAHLQGLIVDRRKRKFFGAESFKIIKHYSFAEDIEGILTALRGLLK